MSSLCQATKVCKAEPCRRHAQILLWIYNRTNSIKFTTLDYNFLQHLICFHTFAYKAVRDGWFHARAIGAINWKDEILINRIRGRVDH